MVSVNRRIRDIIYRELYFKYMYNTTVRPWVNRAITDGIGFFDVTSNLKEGFRGNLNNEKKSSK